ncbi:MAG TPA: hypothetical protein VFC82_05695 [Actinomycetaceae bacterium]|nr:hypothetical protein [Actinomycetaceae bacterium]
MNARVPLSVLDLVPFSRRQSPAEAIQAPMESAAAHFAPDQL